VCDVQGQRGLAHTGRARDRHYGCTVVDGGQDPVDLVVTAGEQGRHRR
jgi:hypothetical protein